MDKIEFVFWIALVFWISWYLHVMFEKLNEKQFNEQRQNVIERLEESKGFARWFGLIMYDMYINPWRSLLIWILVVVLMISGG